MTSDAGACTQSAMEVSARSSRTVTGATPEAHAMRDDAVDSGMRGYTVTARRRIGLALTIVRYVVVLFLGLQSLWTLRLLGQTAVELVMRNPAMFLAFAVQLGVSAIVIVGGLWAWRGRRRGRDMVVGGQLVLMLIQVFAPYIFPEGITLWEEVVVLAILLALVW